MSKDDSSECADKLKALADKTRLAIMLMLQDGPKHVGEIMDQLSAEQSLVSHHLKVLREMKLVVSSREGKRVVYQVAPGVSRDDLKTSIDLGCCSLSFDPEEN